MAKVVAVPINYQSLLESVLLNKELGRDRCVSLLLTTTFQGRAKMRLFKKVAHDFIFTRTSHLHGARYGPCLFGLSSPCGHPSVGGLFLLLRMHCTFRTESFERVISRGRSSCAETFLTHLLRHSITVWCSGVFLLLCTRRVDCHISRRFGQQQRDHRMRRCSVALSSRLLVVSLMRA